MPTSSARRRQTKTNSRKQTISQPAGDDVPPSRSLVDRAFTIQNIQKIAYFACLDYRETFALAFVSKIFEETMKEYHTAHSVLYKYFDFGQYDNDAKDCFEFDSPYCHAIFISVTARIPWMFKELTLKRRDPSPGYDRCVEYALTTDIHFFDRDYHAPTSTTALVAAFADETCPLSWIECVVECCKERGLKCVLEEEVWTESPNSSYYLEYSSRYSSSAPILWRCIFNWYFDFNFPHILKSEPKLHYLIRLHKELGSTRPLQDMLDLSTPGYRDTVWECEPTGVTPLMSVSKLSFRTIIVFLDTCLELGILDNVFRTRNTYDYDDDSSSDYDDTDEEEDDDDDWFCCTDTSYPLRKNAIEYVLDGGAPSKAIVLLRYFMKHTSKHFRRNLLTKRGFKWLYLIFKKENFLGCANLVLQCFESVGVLNELLKCNGDELLGLATRFPPSRTKFVLELLKKHQMLDVTLQSESVLERVVGTDDGDVNSESLELVLNMLKEKTILKKALTAEIDVFSIAVDRLLSADAFRVLLKYYASEGLLDKALTTPPVNPYDKEELSVVSFARRALFRHFENIWSKSHDLAFPEAAEKYFECVFFNKSMHDMQDQVESIKVLIAHCSQHLVTSSNFLPHWKIPTGTTSEIQNLFDEVVGDEMTCGDDIDSYIVILDLPPFEDDECNKLKGDAEAATQKKKTKKEINDEKKRQDAFRQNTLVQFWKKCREWYKKKYGEEPAVDKESGKRRKRGE